MRVPLGFYRDIGKENGSYWYSYIGVISLFAPKYSGGLLEPRDHSLIIP